METLAYLLSGAAFFIWIAGVMAAVITVSNSQRESEAAMQREPGAPSASHRWQFESRYYT